MCISSSFIILIVDAILGPTRDDLWTLFTMTWHTLNHVRVNLLYIKKCQNLHAWQNIVCLNFNYSDLHSNPNTMTLCGKLEADIGIKSPASKFHQLIHRRPHHISNASGDKVQGCELHKGDWGELDLSSVGTSSMVCFYVFYFLESGCFITVSLKLYFISTIYSVNFHPSWKHI